MKVRRFNKKGMELFKEFFQSRVSGAESASLDEMVLSNPLYTEPLDLASQIKARNFDTRYEFGVYLNEALKEYSRDKVMEDEGLWNWLTAFYFQHLFPSPRGAKEATRYIFRPADRLKWYRHLVYTNWDIVSVHGELAKVVLTGQINELNDEIEQLLSRQDFRSNRSVLEAAKLIFYRENKGQGKILQGARDKDPATGTLRRFIVFLQQLLLTYDIYGMSASEIIELLPSEFDRFLDQP